MTNYGCAATGVRPGIAGNDPKDDTSRQRAYAPKLPDVYVTVTGVCPGITVRNPVKLGLAAITRTLNVKAVNRRTPKIPNWVRQCALCANTDPPPDTAGADAKTAQAEKFFASPERGTDPSTTPHVEAEKLARTGWLGNGATVPPTRSARKGTNPHAENGTRTVPGL